MKRLLIFYSHFYPAFKAGGPVQSLVNFVETMKTEFRVFVVCSARDMGDTILLKNIRPDEWNDYKENVSIYYVNDSILRAVKLAFKECQPDVVYINGMFLPGYNWLPLWYAKTKGVKVVLAPRGMLQRGALASKPRKKKIFLKLLRISGLCKNIRWHATDAQERDDIKQIFGKDASVEIAFNIPRVPYPTGVFREKRKSQLKIVYLSLITEKKNLYVIVEALKKIQLPLEFDVYGPIKDPGYWKKCEHLMEGQIHKINYRGLVEPGEVQRVLSQYHLFVLPTKGENFGHAIYDALSVGTPAMISPFTPWGRLQDQQAGLTVEIETDDDWSKAIQIFAALDQTEFNVLSKGAHTLASNYFHQTDFKSAYRKLFDLPQNN